MKLKMAGGDLDTRHGRFDMEIRHIQYMDADACLALLCLATAASASVSLSSYLCVACLLSLSPSLSSSPHSIAPRILPPSRNRPAYGDVQPEITKGSRTTPRAASEISAVRALLPPGCLLADPPPSQQGQANSAASPCDRPPRHRP